MRKYIIALGFLSAILLQVRAEDKLIKVMCVGNSNTLPGREAHTSYPYHLQQFLGQDYLVEDLNVGETTIVKSASNAYLKRVEYQTSLSSGPNIVVIYFGMNVTILNEYEVIKSQFVPDYLELIATYQNLPSQPKVILCQMTPFLSENRESREIYKDLKQSIGQVTELAEVDLIDLYNLLQRFPELFVDQFDLNETASVKIAKQVSSFITGDYGGLQLPILFGEKMVFQRNEFIVVTGVANAGDSVLV